MLTSKEIIEKVKKVPVFSREEVSAQYEGIEVEWVLKFSSINKNKEDLYRVSCFQKEGIFPTVDFEVDIKEYPQFRILDEDTELKISGVIKKIKHQGSTIELERVKILNFPGMSKNEDNMQGNNQKIEGISIHAAHFHNNGQIGGSNNSQAILKSAENKKKDWQEKPLGMIILSVIAAAIIYFLGFN